MKEGASAPIVPGIGVSPPTSPKSRKKTVLNVDQQSTTGRRKSQDSSFTPKAWSAAGKKDKNKATGKESSSSLKSCRTGLTCKFQLSTVSTAEFGAKLCLHYQIGIKSEIFYHC